MKDASQFYANRVVKEFKERYVLSSAGLELAFLCSHPCIHSDPKQVEWARSFIQLLEELKQYVKAHQTTGLIWNKQVRS